VGCAVLEQWPIESQAHAETNNGIFGTSKKGQDTTDASDGSVSACRQFDNKNKIRFLQANTGPNTTIRTSETQRKTKKKSE
jgi:hypothetical protein